LGLKDFAGQRENGGQKDLGKKEGQKSHLLTGEGKIERGVGGSRRASSHQGSVVAKKGREGTDAKRPVKFNTLFGKTYWGKEN